jgi:hypothetical protein
VAAGALTALLGHGITLLQGRATSQACTMTTRLQGDAILVGGRAQAAAVVEACAAPVSRQPSPPRQ